MLSCPCLGGVGISVFKLFNFHSNLHVIKRDSMPSMVSRLISCHPDHASLTLTRLPTCLLCSALATISSVKQPAQAHQQRPACTVDLGFYCYSNDFCPDGFEQPQLLGRVENKETNQKQSEKSRSPQLPPFQCLVGWFLKGRVGVRISFSVLCLPL